MALIDARGAMVSKNALMDRIVEENNRQPQISALRARTDSAPWRCAKSRGVGGWSDRPAAEASPAATRRRSSENGATAENSSLMGPTSITRPTLTDP